MDRLCEAVGFDVLKSYYNNDKTLVFQSIESLLKWFWSSSHGVFVVGKSRNITLFEDEKLLKRRSTFSL